MPPLWFMIYVILLLMQLLFQVRLHGTVVKVNAASRIWFTISLNALLIIGGAFNGVFNG